MKKLLLAILFASAASLTYAQFNSAESVEYDPATSRWYIADNGAGAVIRINQNGTQSTFASGFTTGPHGLELVGSTLFVCDGARVKGYDTTSGTQTSNVNLGATFLNGITHDANGNLYITDFTAKNIYRYTIATGQFNIFYGGLAKSPNGIIFDASLNRLVFVSWGSNAPINRLNIADSSFALLTATTLGNCDGIAMNCQNQFYVASWSPNRISRFDNDFVAAPTNMGVTGLSSPADIFFAQEIDTLGIPNSGSTTVKFQYFSSCLGMGTEEITTETSLFDIQNMPNGKINVRVFGDLDNRSLIEIFSIDGKLISTTRPQSNQEFFTLPEGIFIVRYSNEKHQSVLKTVILR